MSEENKPVVAIFHGNGSADAIEQYHQTIKGLEAAGAGSPEGRLYHVAYATEDGYVVVDVWESAELLEQFSSTLVPVIQKIGGTPAEPQIHPVINIIN